MVGNHCPSRSNEYSRVQNNRVGVGKIGGWKIFGKLIKGVGIKGEVEKLMG